tara:strand:- start:1489 stop:1737 length:249 start_codon:yes stop_codon:yes gene_type:complete
MTERFIIFGRSTCPFCTMAEDYLNCMQKQSRFLDYATKPSILEDYKEFYGQETVPIILSNNLETGLVKKIGGYSDLLEYLDG